LIFAAGAQEQQGLRGVVPLRGAEQDILWFYPRAEPEHKDVLQRKPPPVIPEIEDPEFITVCGIRDLP
jgi:hypothetical protein